MTYVGIDLGTTNSVIATFDGRRVQVHRSPEQNEVTPSAIFYNTRGAQFVGARAYQQEVLAPDQGARKFKRLMGTNSMVAFPKVNKELTPVEASAVVLSTLFGYLPEEQRTDEATATVITIPAAFNQLQREATLEAAHLANIGRVALMQEPVAAIMSVMASEAADGVFVVYDLGGGTLDVAIAESHAGRVNLLAHGGVAMLGGADFDRLVFDALVQPWLYDTFNLPPQFHTHERFRKLYRLALYRIEQAKIGLSGSDQVDITIGEDELATEDLDGQDIYIEMVLNRTAFDPLIKPLLDRSISATREALKDVSLSTIDVERLVFVGGPTQYKPLRDYVSVQLGLQASTGVDPMTAVAGGSAIFAESIDWDNEDRGRKRARSSVDLGGSFSFRFNARTPESRTKVSIQATDREVSGVGFEFLSVVTGWTSGRITYPATTSVDLPLGMMGANDFSVQAFAPTGEPIRLATDRIVITRVAATIDAIPASHSIKIEARRKAGGQVTLIPLVNKGDDLPKRGAERFKAGHSLPSGSSDSLNFRLWEGEGDLPADGNQPVGVFQVRGEHLLDGTIRAGAELIFSYEISESGTITASVSVPEVQATFQDLGNLYAYKEATRDFGDAAEEVRADLRTALTRLDDMESAVADPRLDEARQRLEEAEGIDIEEAEAEDVKRADEAIRESRRILAQVRQDNRQIIQRSELERIEREFDEDCRSDASLSEQSSFDNLVRTTRRAIDSGRSEVDEYLEDLRSQIFRVLWQQSWFVQSLFDGIVSTPWRFADRKAFDENVVEGRAAIERGDLNRLKGIVATLYRSRTDWDDTDDDPGTLTNIIAMS